jgi:hypothetical protein
MGKIVHQSWFYFQDYVYKEAARSTKHIILFSCGIHPEFGFWIYLEMIYVDDIP